MGDRDIFHGLKQEDQEKRVERLKVLFPHASNYGGVDILNNISKRLLEGIVEPRIWYAMNAYQYCYLYDSLAAVAEDYSYSNLEQRIKIYPEMMGTDIDFNNFLNKYFCNTAFLINSDRYNEMDSVDKSQQGFNDPCLFGVINRLTPTKDEMQLKQLEAQSKSATQLLQENRKDDRTKMQATQQSAMIDQKENQKPAQDFESSNDMLGGFNLGV